MGQWDDKFEKAERVQQLALHQIDLAVATLAIVVG